MGAKEGFLTQETLTGFKYLANAAQKLETERPGLKVLLAFEEAIGFMINSTIWDKDGISAMCLMYLMVLDVYSHGKTLAATLAEIYTHYGYFAQYNSYYFCDPVRVPSIFAILRTKLRERVPGSTTDLTGACQISLNSEQSIMSIKDYPGSNMITLCFGHGWVTLRASGTEPKIKFYSEMHSKSAKKMETDEKLQILVNNLCQWLLDPEMNKLILQRK
jgi:phosphomannomutase